MCVHPSSLLLTRCRHSFCVSFAQSCSSCMIIPKWRCHRRSRPCAVCSFSPWVLYSDLIHFVQGNRCTLLRTTLTALRLRIRLPTVAVAVALALSRPRRTNKHARWRSHVRRPRIAQAALPAHTPAPVPAAAAVAEWGMRLSLRQRLVRGSGSASRTHPLAPRRRRLLPCLWSPRAAGCIIRRCEPRAHSSSTGTATAAIMGTMRASMRMRRPPLKRPSSRGTRCSG